MLSFFNVTITLRGNLCLPFSGYQKNVNGLIQNNGDLSILRQLSQSNEGSKEYLINLLAQNII